MDSISVSRTFILILQEAMYISVALLSRCVCHFRSKVSTLMRTRPHPLHNLRLRLNITNLATLPTRPRLLIFSKLIDRILNLTPQIRTHKTILMNHIPTTPTIPSQSIFISLRSGLLDNHTHSICKPYRVVWCIPRQEKDFSFIDVDVAETAFRCNGF